MTPAVNGSVADCNPHVVLWRDGGRVGSDGVENQRRFEPAADWVAARVVCVVVGDNVRVAAAQAVGAVGGDLRLACVDDLDLGGGRDARVGASTTRGSAGDVRLSRPRVDHSVFAATHCQRIFRNAECGMRHEKRELILLRDSAIRNKRYVFQLKGG